MGDKFITIAFDRPMSDEDEKALIRTFMRLDGVTWVKSDKNDPYLRPRPTGEADDLIAALRRFIVRDVPR